MPAATSRLPCRSAILRLSSGIIQTGPFRRLFSAPATAFAGRIRCYRAERGIGRYFFFAKNRYLSGYVFQVLHRVAVVVAAAGVRSGAGDGAAYRPPPRSASRYDPPESGGPETGLALRQRLSQTQGFVAAQRQPAPSGRTAQPASLRQYPFEDDAPCRTAFALPDALRQPRTRYDSQRTGAGREPAVRTLLRPADRRGGHRAGSGVHPRRQLARTHGQQTARDDARAGAAARPALRTRGYDRSGAAGAQPPAAPFARLYLGCDDGADTGFARLDARGGHAAFARQLDDQRRCGAARRGPDDDRSLRRQHLRLGQPPERCDQFQPQRFRLRRQRRLVRHPQLPGVVLQGQLFGGPRFLQQRAAHRRRQGVHPADRLRTGHRLQQRQGEVLSGRPRHLRPGQVEAHRRLGWAFALHSFDPFERLPHGALRLTRSVPT